MPAPHHPKSPLMEKVDAEAELLRDRYGGFVPGAALAATMRNLMADHDRRLIETETCLTDLAAAVVKLRKPAK